MKTKHNTTNKISLIAILLLVSVLFSDVVTAKNKSKKKKKSKKESSLTVDLDDTSIQKIKRGKKEGEANVKFSDESEGIASQNESNEQTEKDLALPTIAQEEPKEKISGIKQEIKDTRDLEKKEKEENEEANIYLNFENVSLSNIVNYLSEQKKINLIPSKDLEAVKVTLNTRKPLTLTRAWNVLLTLMEMNGFSIVNVNGIYKIIPSKDNSFEALPVYSSYRGKDKKGTPPEALPDSDLVVRYIYFFQNIKAEVAEGILKTMLPSDQAVIINRDLNACIIKEQCLNIKAAMKIVQELDTGGLREAIKVVRLKHADADTVQRLFEDILGNGEQGQRTIRFTTLSSKKDKQYFSASTKIIADPAKNHLILLGTEKNIKKVISFINKYIDVPIGKADSRLHIKEIKYAKAEDLKPIIERVIKPPAGQGTEKSAVVGDYKFFEDVTIAAETASAAGDGLRGSGNRLIIACNQDDWRRLEQFIEKLDKPQPQVSIEVMIIDVDITKDKSLGAQTLNFKGKSPGMGVNRVEFRNLSSANPVETTQGGEAVTKTVSNLIDLAQPEFLGNNCASFLTLGSATSENQNIWSIIRATFNVDNSHVISQPFMVVNNYQKCVVNVSESRRIPAGLISSHGEATRQQKKPVDADIKVEITPQINIEGLVDLDLDVIIDEFQDVGNVEDPNKTKRSLKTRVSMMTGEVLVLGGLTRSSQQETHARTPILGSIPIIGNLFKSKEKIKTERNLYIFMRPSIIKPRFEGEPDEYTQLKLDYAKLQMMRNDTYTADRDPIQRWFFKPTHLSIQEKVSETKRGIFRPIDNFTYGKTRPKSVTIADDPYYKVSESITKQRGERAKRKEREQVRRKKEFERLKLKKRRGLGKTRMAQAASPISENKVLEGVQETVSNIAEQQSIPGGNQVLSQLKSRTPRTSPLAAFAQKRAGSL